jgi:hypothetical protein
MPRRKLVALLLDASVWTSSTSSQEQSRPIVEITFEGALALAR